MKPSAISKQFIILALGAGWLALQPSAFGANAFNDWFEADGASGSFQATILGVNTTVTVPPVAQQTLTNRGSAEQDQARFSIGLGSLTVVSLHEIANRVIDFDDPNNDAGA